MEIKKPKRYKAKAKNKDCWFEGYYFEMPETTYCFEEDGEIKTLYYLIVWEPTDWGIPNRMGAIEIDINTLEEIDN